jgi:hypothetical protein
MIAYIAQGKVPERSEFTTFRSTRELSGKFTGALHAYSQGNPDLVGMKIVYYNSSAALVYQSVFTISYFITYILFLLFFDTNRLYPVSTPFGLSMGIILGLVFGKFPPHFHSHVFILIFFCFFLFFFFVVVLVILLVTAIIIVNWARSRKRHGGYKLLLPLKSIN